MAEERTSNYIKLCDEWAEKFLQMEKKELMNRLPELKEEDGYLKITHFVCHSEFGWTMEELTGWQKWQDCL